MRRLFVILCAVSLLMGVMSTSASAGKTKTPGAVLRCVQADGLTQNPCFSAGSSADGGGQSIKLDTVNANGTTGVAFDNWWCQKLESVQQLKISTQEPVTAGSPRISMYLSDANCTLTYDANSNPNTLFLSPYYCNSSNANGWRMSNWRSDASCTLFYNNEPTGYAGWNAFTASHPNMTIWFAFVIQDGDPQPPAINHVDRIQLDTQLFTK